MRCLLLPPPSGRLSGAARCAAAAVRPRPVAQATVTCYSHRVRSKQSPCADETLANSAVPETLTGLRCSAACVPRISVGAADWVCSSRCSVCSMSPWGTSRCVSIETVRTASNGGLEVTCGIKPRSSKGSPGCAEVLRPHLPPPSAQCPQPPAARRAPVQRRPVAQASVTAVCSFSSSHTQSMICSANDEGGVGL